MRVHALLPSCAAALLCGTALSAQVVEVQTKPRGAVVAAGNRDPVDLLARGFFDVVTSGQVQASAQVIKLRIGEPDGFSMPVYLLTGATRTTFGNAEEAEAAVLDLVAPNGGFVNVMTNIYANLINSNTDVTSLKFTGSIGGRLISAREQSEGDVSIFGAGYAHAGLYFQTGARIVGPNPQDGIFWIQAAYSGSLLSNNQLQTYFGADAEAPRGLRGELGIFIKERVNLKLGAFIPDAGKSLPALDKTLVRFAFDYNVK
jgi:hypothetical protein